MLCLDKLKSCLVRELKETRNEVKAIIKILLGFFKVMTIVMALFIS